MAKGCMYYHIETCDGGPWQRWGLPFRVESEQAAEDKYREALPKIDARFSVRLCAARVLEQRNGHR